MSVIIIPIIHQSDTFVRKVRTYVRPCCSKYWYDVLKPKKYVENSWKIMGKMTSEYSSMDIQVKKMFSAFPHNHSVMKLENDQSSLKKHLMIKSIRIMRSISYQKEC